MPAPALPLIEGIRCGRPGSVAFRFGFGWRVPRFSLRVLARGDVRARSSSHPQSMFCMCHNPYVPLLICRAKGGLPLFCFSGALVYLWFCSASPLSSHMKHVRHHCWKQILLLYTIHPSVSQARRILSPSLSSHCSPISHTTSSSPLYMHRYQRSRNNKFCKNRLPGPIRMEGIHIH